MIFNGITGFVGEFGTGKTMHVTLHCLRALYFGHTVYSNFKIESDFNPPFRKRKHVKAIYCSTGEEMRWTIANKDNCVFAVDETAIYLPQSYWNKMPPEIIVKFHQVRHYDAAIWYTVQEFDESVKTLRRLTNIVYQHEVYHLGLFDLFVSKMFKRKYFEGMPTDKKYELYYRGTEIIYPSEARSAFRAYNTKEKIETSMHFKL